jgi:hypothetical protein
MRLEWKRELATEEMQGEAVQQGIQLEDRALYLSSRDVPERRPRCHGHRVQDDPAPSTALQDTTDLAERSWNIGIRQRDTRNDQVEYFAREREVLGARAYQQKRRIELPSKCQRLRVHINSNRGLSRRQVAGDQRLSRPTSDIQDRPVERRHGRQQMSVGRAVPSDLELPEVIAPAVFVDHHAWNSW